MSLNHVTVLFFFLWNHWPGILYIQSADINATYRMTNGMKLWIIIESESAGLVVRTESKCNFPALICFHYLSKAIISLFSLHNAVWYDRMMQSGERSDSARVCLTTKHVMICVTELFVILNSIGEVFIVVAWAVFVYVYAVTWRCP